MYIFYFIVVEHNKLNHAVNIVMVCRDAVNINILGVQRMLSICKSLPYLEVK